MLDRVVGEIEEQLAQTMTVAGDRQRAALGHAHLNIVRPSQALRIGAGFPEQLVQADWIDAYRAATDFLERNLGK